MMIQSLKCEIYKIKTLKSLLIAFVIPLVMTTIGLTNVYNGVVPIKTTANMWDALYNQSSILYGGLTLPLTIIIIISLQWRIEYKHNSIILTNCSPINLEKIYVSKIITTIIFVFINILMYIGILLIFSRLLLPNEKIQLYFIYSPLVGLLFSIPFILIQHLLSMLIKNFIPPIAIGIILTFIGFILSGTTSLGILIPNMYLYYGLFFNVPNTQIILNNLLFIIAPILAIIISFLGTSLFKNIEV